MTTMEYRLYPRPTKRDPRPGSAGPQPYSRHSSRPGGEARPETKPGPNDTNGQVGSLLHPQGELAERARRYGLAREAAQAIPRTHLPVWRLRFAIALRFLPVLWAFPKCQAEECRHWPCKPLLRYLRNTYGWSFSIDEQLKALSTKRRRARASRRNPGAVSHRAVNARRGMAMAGSG